MKKHIFIIVEGNYMELNMKVKIQGNRSNKTEYLIRDIDDIIIGRFSTDELTSRSKTCNVNLKFYREYNYDY